MHNPSRSVLTGIYTISWFHPIFRRGLKASATDTGIDADLGSRVSTLDR